MSVQNLPHDKYVSPIPVALMCMCGTVRRAEPKLPPPALSFSLPSVGLVRCLVDLRARPPDPV